MKEAEIRRHEEERLRYEEQERQRKARGRAKRLLRQAGSLRQAEDIRLLIERVRNSSQGEAHEATEKWLSWATRVADSLDPVSGIAETLNQGKDPSEPEYEDLYSERRW